MPRSDVTPTIGCNELDDIRLDAMARAMIRRLQDVGLDAAAANMWVSRAGARVVILDCCFSGAVERIFRYGTAKGDVAVPPESSPCRRQPSPMRRTRRTRWRPRPRHS